VLPSVLLRRSYFIFLPHLLAVVSHLPPAFSQSAFEVYFAMSAPLPGLADGEPDEPEPEVDPLPELLPEPDVPDGVLPELELPEPLLPLPLLLLAAAIAGTRAMMPMRTVTNSFCIAISSRCGWDVMRPAGRSLSVHREKRAIFTPPTATPRARAERAPERARMAGSRQCVADLVKRSVVR
jgi:hypothetical protein